MKNILFLFLILFSLNLIGQNNNDLKTQKEDFKKAEELLKNSDIFEALFYYRAVYLENLKTTVEIKAKKKIDSLYPICFKREISKWKGKWRLKQLKTHLFTFEKIIIDENEISFYNKVNDTTASRNERIKYAKFDPKDFLVNPYRIKFKNNEIWEFSTEKSDRELRLFPHLRTESNGTSWLILDERGIIRNKVDREKAYAEERRTYYLPIK